jgi:hypothetical protein
MDSGTILHQNLTLRTGAAEPEVLQMAQAFAARLSLARAHFEDVNPAISQVLQGPGTTRISAVVNHKCPSLGGSAKFITDPADILRGRGREKKREELRRGRYGPPQNHHCQETSRLFLKSWLFLAA